MREVILNEIKILSARNQPKFTALVNNFTWENMCSDQIYENGYIFLGKKMFKGVVGGSNCD